VRLRQEAEKRNEPGFPWLFVPLALALLLAGGWLLSERWHDANRWERYVERLKAEPGIVVTGVDRQHGKWMVSGLRDPLAADPNQLLRESGLSPDHVSAKWQPYQAFNTPLVLKRLQGSLDPPPTLALFVEGEAIVATGSASRGWLRKARSLVNAMPLGSPAVDLTRVRDLNDPELGQLTTAIESHSIHFDYNEPLPASGQEKVFDELAIELRKLADLSARLRIAGRVIVTGNSDARGTGTFNLSLSVARAEAVRSFLIQRGVDPGLLAARGAGPLEPLKPETSDVARSLNRRVSFTVKIDG
jgi:OOP family OmpA-OmpF porin